jgi:hypothetical protein
MNILLKYPTRGRPTQFLKTLGGWLGLAQDLKKIRVLVSCDTDDLTMSDSVIAESQRMHSEVLVVRGNNANKIAACNANLNAYQGTWDVVLLVSDDMICTVLGWDSIIRKCMDQHFPDTDGALWFFDGRQFRFNTLECVGRKRYERFNYLYHPSYRGFYCDYESTEVGQRDGKLVRIEQSICSHENPCWKGSMSFDDTYARSVPWIASDHDNYTRRKLANFPLEMNLLK